MQKLKKGDTVIVLGGRDKGRTGTIEKVNLKKGTAIVPGVNMVKKHVKKAVATDGKGGIYDIPKAIPISKLALSREGKKVKVGFASREGKKIRINKKTKKKI